MNLGTGQDWNEVVLRKKPQSAAARKDEAAVNAVGVQFAIRAGRGPRGQGGAAHARLPAP
jgi:hypothetical protein